MSFVLHHQLAADTFPVSDLPHSRLLLMNNAHFPWLILVPRGEYRELFDLGGDYAAVMEEVRHIAERFAAHTNAHKINVAALGNMVPQLHIHIIARFTHDAAWPSPVWSCKEPARAYTANEAQEMIAALRQLFQNDITNL